MDEDDPRTFGAAASGASVPPGPHPGEQPLDAGPGAPDGTAPAPRTRSTQNDPSWWPLLGALAVLLRFLVLILVDRVG